MPQPKANPLRVVVLLGAAACVLVLLVVFASVDCTPDPAIPAQYVCDPLDKPINSVGPPTELQIVAAYIVEVAGGGVAVAGLAWLVLMLLAKINVGDD